jgi:putative hemolysin
LAGLRVPVYALGTPSPARPILTELLVILLLVLANGIFSGAEIAVITMRKTRLRELAEEGSSRAKALLWLRSHPERFLATVQVAITVISASAAAFGGASVAARLTPVIAHIPGLEKHAEDVSLGLVIALVSYLSLVLGELVPKSLALRSSEAYAMAVGRPLRFISSVARPLAWFLTASSNVVLRPFGDRTNFTESRVSTEELQQLVDEATRAGALDSHSGEIASRALEFGDLTAGAVMVPRNKVDAIARDASLDELKKLIIDSGRSRLPVYEDTLDNIVGYVTARDLVAAILDGRPVDVDHLLRPTHFVPRSTRAIDVLKDLQKRQMQLAIVVDEHGGVSGILTLEDLVEELVGEIFAEDEKPEEQIHMEAEGLALVAGSTPIRDLNRALDLDLPENDEWTTLAGLCTSLAGGIPRKGDRLRDESGITYEITSATPRAVGQVRLILPEREKPEGGRA